MGNVASEVFANDDVPGRTVASVKLLLDMRRDVLLDVVLLQSRRGDVHALLLHLVAHVDVLDGRFQVGWSPAAGGGRAAYACVGGSGRCVDFFGHWLLGFLDVDYEGVVSVNASASVQIVMRVGEVSSRF
jgi:hypothetical protein